MSTAEQARSGMQASDFEQMEANAGDAAQLLKSLAHETRLQILCHLVSEELSVGQINACVGGSQSVISQHLAVLRKQDLVRTRREGQTIYYRLGDPRAARLLEVLYELFCQPGKDDRKDA